MGVLREPPPAKLVVAVMYRPGVDTRAVEDRLSDRFSPIDLRSPVIPFDHADYYREEMGEGLLKYFVSFATPLPQDRLAGIKLATVALERDLAVEGRRTVNLDPGMLTLASLILSTAKGYAHRVYLGEGVYAEAELTYHQGGFHGLPWTYPDYLTTPVLDFLVRARSILHEQLNGPRTA